jgi:hypothetical protein
VVGRTEIGVETEGTSQIGQRIQLGDDVMSANFVGFGFSVPVVRLADPRQDTVELWR